MWHANSGDQVNILQGMLLGLYSILYSIVTASTFGSPSVGPSTCVRFPRNLILGLYQLCSRLCYPLKGLCWIIYHHHTEDRYLIISFNNPTDVFPEWGIIQKLVTISQLFNEALGGINSYVVLKQSQAPALRSDPISVLFFRTLLHNITHEFYQRWQSDDVKIHPLYCIFYICRKSYTPC